MHQNAGHYMALICAGLLWGKTRSHPNFLPLRLKESSLPSHKFSIILDIYLLSSLCRLIALVHVYRLYESIHQARRRCCPENTANATNR